MPVINLQMLGKATREQKAQIVAEFTDTLVRVLNKTADGTIVIFNEKETDDWGRGGKLIADQLSAQPPKA